MAISTVLMIEDEGDIRRIGQVALRSVGGWNVLVAASGEEGLELARSGRPDVILLDVMMPGLDGPGTLERLRAQPETREIPVVFLTANPDAADLATYRALGVRGVIAKPFNPLTLPRQIREMLGPTE